MNARCKLFTEKKLSHMSGEMFGCYYKIDNQLIKFIFIASQDFNNQSKATKGAWCFVYAQLAGLQGQVLHPCPTLSTTFIEEPTWEQGLSCALWPKFYHTQAIPPSYRHFRKLCILIMLKYFYSSTSRSHCSSGTIFKWPTSVKKKNPHKNYERYQIGMKDTKFLGRIAWSLWPK